jgi:hypothetical protein
LLEPRPDVEAFQPIQRQYAPLVNQVLSPSPPPINRRYPTVSERLKVLEQLVDGSRRAIRISHDLVGCLQERVERQAAGIQQLKRAVGVLVDRQTVQVNRSNFSLYPLSRILSYCPAKN